MARRPRSARRAAPTPGPLFLRPERGMRELVDALAGALGDGLRTGVEVAGVSEGDGRARRRRLGAGRRGRPRVRRPSIGGPARLRGAAGPRGRSAPSRPGSCSSSTRPGPASALPDGTGFVVPRGAAPMTAATFVSRKWPDARFEDRAVVRCYVGGAGDEDVLDAADAEIVERLRAASRRGARPPRTHRRRASTDGGERCRSTSAAIVDRVEDIRAGSAGGYLRRRERVRRGRRLRPRSRRRGDGGAGARARGRAPAREEEEPA